MIVEFLSTELHVEDDFDVERLDALKVSIEMLNFETDDFFYEFDDPYAENGIVLQWRIINGRDCIQINFMGHYDRNNIIIPPKDENKVCAMVEMSNGDVNRRDLTFNFGKLVEIMNKYVAGERDCLLK